MPDLDRLTAFLKNIVDKTNDMAVVDSEVGCDPDTRLFNVASLDGNDKFFEVAVTDLTDRESSRPEEDDDDDVKTAQG
jgi:hypothetical protein